MVLPELNRRVLNEGEDEREEGSREADHEMANPNVHLSVGAFALVEDLGAHHVEVE